jgi:hypothetical protein
MLVISTVQFQSPVYPIAPPQPILDVSFYTYRVVRTPPVDWHLIFEIKYKNQVGKLEISIIKCRSTRG